MKKFNALYNKIILEYFDQIQYDQLAQTLIKPSQIINTLKSHGHIVELTDQDNTIIVKDAYYKDGIWYDEMLQINPDGSLKNSEGDTYKNILSYLGY